MNQQNKLLEVAGVMFKIGTMAFGGPAVHISMLEEEVVTKRKWMTHEHFLDLMGATNLIPGPNSTQMTMHCSKERAGNWGLFIGGFAFIFPAVFITGIIAWLYFRYSTLPEFVPYTYGIKPAVLIVIGSAVLKLGKKALKNWELAILGLGVFLASVLGVNEIAALLGAGLLGFIYFSIKNSKTKLNSSILFPVLMSKISFPVLAQLTNLNIFLSFLKIALVLYGSGYVLFAYVDAELVEKGWLTRQQLLDAIAVGQFTPGPILSTATFIGYQLTGIWGAILATVGLFLPSFILVMILNPLVPKMRKSEKFRYLLDSVNIAAVAVIAAVLFIMAKETLLDWRTITIAATSIVATMIWKKINTMWIVAGGAFLGYLLMML